MGKEIFDKEKMQEVQNQVDSVNEVAVIDRLKLSGLPITKQELGDLLCTTVQLINGFKPDAVEGGYWSEWDESVLQGIYELQRKLL